MSKGLEALKTVGNIKVDNDIETFIIKDISEYKTIEKELKEKEELQKLLDHERDLNNHLITHEVKALDIIKEKRVNVKAFLMCCNEKTGLLIYNSQVLENQELTEEEFNLLKEVLLCPKN